LLVVGLGNPGREYASTRHNVGWMALDELASRAGAGAFKKKFSGEYATGSFEGASLVLLRPETYMNESGRSVQPAAAFFHAAPASIVVLHDELDLPFGDVRLKVGGGHAGHNGLRSLIQHLGSPDFVRVRIGIGRPPPGFRGEVADYVLSSFDPVERASIPDVVARTVDTVRSLVQNGLERAMNQVNTRPKGDGAGDSRGGRKVAARAVGV
jgi:PTH1 family peptidyl-tRNA hydrolase